METSFFLRWLEDVKTYCMWYCIRLLIVSISIYMDASFVDLVSFIYDHV